MQPWQRTAERNHALELVRIAHRPPAFVVAVLFAPARIDARRLEMAP